MFTRNLVYPYINSLLPRQALYSRLFDYVVDAINESLISGEEGRYFIGAVDIFGFECFPKNSLEQLCINFANEKLQRMFTEVRRISLN